MSHVTISRGARDEGQSRSASVSKSQRRTIIVGDVHGDLVGLDRVLVHAGLLGANNQWIGANAVLIQLGDVVDRGPDSVQALDRLRELQRQAPISGGEVIRLAGNHETELAADRFCISRGLEDPRAVGHRIRIEIADSSIVAAAMAGPWLCIHGGLQGHLRRQLTVTDSKVNLPALVKGINALFRRAAITGNYDHPLFDHEGIFWSSKHDLLASADSLEVPQIVGHVLTSEPFCREHRLITLDQGLSSAMRGHLSYLELANKTAVWHSKGKLGDWRQTAKSATPAPTSDGSDV